jgi:hypothetical protein
MNTLAELPSTVAIITVTGLMAITISGCVACHIVAIIAKVPDRAGLAACLNATANVIRAVRRHRP